MNALNPEIEAAPTPDALADARRLITDPRLASHYDEVRRKAAWQLVKAAHQRRLAPPLVLTHNTPGDAA